MEFLNSSFEFNQHDSTLFEENGPQSSVHEVPEIFTNDYAFDYEHLTPPITASSSFITDDFGERSIAMMPSATQLSPEYASLQGSLMGNMMSATDYSFMQPDASQQQMAHKYSEFIPQISQMPQYDFNGFPIYYDMPMYPTQPYGQAHFPQPPKKRASKSNVAFNPMAQPSKTGILPVSFNCESCPAVFKRNAELRRHVTSIHFQSKSYVCQTCSTAFGRKDALKRHMTSRVVGKHCAGSRRRSSKIDTSFVQGISQGMNYKMDMPFSATIGQDMNYNAL